MEGRDEPQNLYNLATVSCGISRTGPRNLAKFSAEKLWALIICACMLYYCNMVRWARA